MRRGSAASPRECRRCRFRHETTLSLAGLRDLTYPGPLARQRRWRVATTITFPDNLTPRAKRTLRQASEEAKRMGAEGFIGVEHIFLAILADKRAIPTQVMDKLGVAGDARREVEAVLLSDGYRASSKD
jgi:ATP-dependent Clp protease ATP-binding subunit ClpA